MTADPDRKRILLTVEVEDYFHVGKFDRLIQRDQWYRFEPRLERNMRKALALLDQFDTRGTFFVLGWVAETMPELVREVIRRGHEVASMGYDHRTIQDMDRSSLRDDVRRSREALERATGRRVLGHRVPHYLGPEDVWALDVLAEEGYAYDSSIKPIFRRFAREPWRRVVHEHRHGERSLWELPLSASHLGLSVPIAGAGYFRHFPHALVRQAVRHWHRKHRAPFVMYFRIWELDPDQPRIHTAPLLSRVRHYRNLHKMAWILQDYFQEYHVTGIAEYLGLSTEAVARPAPAAALAESQPYEVTTQPEPIAASRPQVTIVVPCFNEESSLVYLSNTLRSVKSRLEDAYQLEFVFVEDGSSDGSWECLGRVFGDRPDCVLLRHDRNRGVAAAILTGIRAARAEIVCSIDCDCTYDPHQLKGMIPLLSEGVDLVTASPYHPQGLVRNVPPWRLALSRGASFLYRRILHHKLYTYTSCFRVYRKSAVQDLALRQGGFLGVAEMLGQLDLRGAHIVECPAVLDVRILGHSKMKALRAILGHLRLLGHLLTLRLWRGRGVPVSKSVSAVP